MDQQARPGIEISEKIISTRSVENEGKGRPHQVYWISRVMGCFIQDKIDQRRLEFDASIANLQTYFPAVR